MCTVPQQIQKSPGIKLCYTDYSQLLRRPKKIPQSCRIVSSHHSGPYHQPTKVFQICFSPFSSVALTKTASSEDISSQDSVYLSLADLLFCSLVGKVQIDIKMRHYYTSSPWDHGYFRPRGSFDAAQGPYGIKNVSFDCAFECTPSVFLQIPSHLKALCMWVFLCLRPGTGPATIRSSGFLLTQKSPWCFQLVINAMLSLLARTVDL